MLFGLDIEENMLTGNVPAEIMNKSASFDNLNVYGNKLSNLIPVDGRVICTADGNNTQGSSEHYCDCASDCMRELNNGFGKLCQCSGAKDCCESYFEKNNITNCVLCEQELSNPELILPAFNFVNCSFIAAYVFDKLDVYGTAENCNTAKQIFYNEGCNCPSYVPS